MDLSDLDYDLPEELIAQQPLKRRETSRMLTVDRTTGVLANAMFVDLPRCLFPGDVLVLNDTKVFPARLYGQIATGANVEIFLVREIDNGIWESLARPARRLSTGKKIVFSERLAADVVEKRSDGKVVVQFETAGDLYQILDEIGRTPLPPYIKRDNTAIDTDRDRYQTVFAKNRGAIAAPTAGLHFTSEILDAIRDQGVNIVEITLHVGYGTFEPIRSRELKDHAVLPENYEISENSAQVLNQARNDGRRIVAVGTTTTRALESNLTRNGKFLAGPHIADLTVTPGYSFLAIDALLTNFHLPQSSLLLLVSVFGGRDLIINAYRHAVAEKYRFYSYGDCMLIS
jgi:S-adenosylmethionine:tRNA ribosyltransferase-isomerase